MIRAGFAISGTWPMRTELATGMSRSGTNALASSIVLVCRPRAADAPTATRREFVTALKAELPVALAHLQRGNIAPVDLAQAAIGPGMAVYTRYAKVLDAEGKPLTVREALALINQTLDEALAEQEGDFDADSRWALAWFEQSGFAEGEYGVAETLSKSKNTSVAGMVEAGILASKARQGAAAQARRAARRLGPGHRPAPHRLGDGAPPDPRARSGGEGAAASSSPSSAARPRSPASWPIASTRSASARSARQRRSPTTASSRAGPRSRASPGRATRRAARKPAYSRTKHDLLREDDFSFTEGAMGESAFL